MEVRPGYKQTEAGVIPEEWEVAQISSLLAAPIQNGVFNEPSRKGHGFRLINVIDLYGRFPLEAAGLERFAADKDEISRFAVRSGDVFFTRSSLTAEGIAMCNVYEGDDEDPIVFDCHIIRVRPNVTRVHPLFLARSCGSREARRHLVINAKTTTMTTIDQSVIARLPVPLPSIPEQRAIAEALRDVDALLDGMDRLIAKKRDLKKAAMQELLTGQTRLPGFQGEWEARRLGSTGKCLRGVSYNGDDDLSAYDTATTKRLLRSNNVQGSTVVTTDVQYVNAARVSAHQVLARGDILICMANGSKALVGKAGQFNLDDGHEYTFGAFMGCFRMSASNAESTFVFYLFQTGRYRDFVNDLLAGSSINNLKPSSIESLEFAFPTLREQVAIAAVLSDMDAELTALEARRDKTRTLKQAMMQELLTGRTRLV